MCHDGSTDYETYEKIMGELLAPIEEGGLDTDTLRRLYESKLVYLDNLRSKCFRELNSKDQTHFTVDDLTLVMKAKSETIRHLDEAMRRAILSNLTQLAS